MALFLFLLFIALPVAELYVIIQVGQWIGVLPTLALMMLSALVGAALARSQGRQVWRRFNEMMRAGRVPGREVFDGAMIVFGGALLLSPGFTIRSSWTRSCCARCMVPTPTPWETIW